MKVDNLLIVNIEAIIYKTWDLMIEWNLFMKMIISLYLRCNSHLEKKYLINNLLKNKRAKYNFCLCLKRKVKNLLIWAKNYLL